MQTVLVPPVNPYSLRSKHHAIPFRSVECASSTKVPRKASNQHPSESTGSSNNLSFMQSISSSKSESDCETVEMPNASKIITNYSVDPYDYSEKELVVLSVAMFKHYKLPEIFEFSESTLSNFFFAVKDLYRTNNDFHNFHHAWGVMHNVFQILLNGVDRYLDNFDIFASLVAAICHDVGHPGNNNAFELAIKSPVSRKYGQKDEICVLEKFHASETESLLSKRSRRTNSNLLVSLSEDAKERFVHQVRFIILGTDMAKHSSLVNEANDLVQKILGKMNACTSSDCSSTLTTQESISSCSQSNDCQLVSSEDLVLEKEFRLALTRIIVHCADIGAQTQHISIASKWAERVYREFRSQAEKEKALGIVTTPFLHELQEDYMMYTSQAGFIAGVVLPIWTAICRLCPRLQFAVDQLSSNRAHYAEVGEELKNKNVAQQQQQQQQNIDNNSTPSSCAQAGSTTQNSQESPHKRLRQ